MNDNNTDEFDFSQTTDAVVLPDDDTTPIVTAPSPIEEMTALRDALQDQVTAYQDLLGQLRALMVTPTPTPPPTAIGNPAQTTPLQVDDVRGMDVMTVKRRLDEVLDALKAR